MIKPIFYLTLWFCLGVSCGWSADFSLNENAFQEHARRLKNEIPGRDRLRRAKEAFVGQRLTSLQAKHIATLLPDDAARLDFATVIYPAVADPDNFYEVYDAFTTFSKVLRLHDQVRQMRHPSPSIPLPPAAPQPVTPQAMQDILKSLRGEPFNENRQKLARQIIGSSRQPFLTSQIKEILALFPFDDDKLAVAKFAYDYTLDREVFYQLNDAFVFSRTRESLTRYLESKRLGR